MLGRKIFDPFHTESNNDSVEGLNLLPMTTTFNAEKLTRQVTLDEVNFDFLNDHINAKNLDGYEIHAGETKFDSEMKTKSIMTSENHIVIGTYVHGIFDNDNFRLQILNSILKYKGLPQIKNTRNVRAEKQRNYERLADITRKNLNMKLLKTIIND